ncbi:hypothetical protein E3E36_01090 [Thermococcus sp. M36]|uniref:hypothetical protein n=1 Tax=Thermococcus sp. M36 TaxID=1638261 RepID=UPI00143C7ED0|nr:hypothetical protein [Thermococcus sp. M36]NJE04769.1 hypothetical protein [Thermococcus sp. M36]
MRRLYAILIVGLFMTALSPISAWDTTIKVPAKEYHTIDDITIEYNSTCGGWVFGVVEWESGSRAFAFLAGRSGTLRLSEWPYPDIHLDIKGNASISFQAECPLNISVRADYGPDFYGDRFFTSEWRYRIVRMPFVNVTNDTYVLESPWPVLAVYLETDYIYFNGTYVPDLTMDSELDIGLTQIESGPERIAENVWWYDLSGFRPRELRLTLKGPRAGFITKVYGYALVPYREHGYLANFEDGYTLWVSSLRRYVRITCEGLWTGENFTLFRFRTDRGEEHRVYVQDGVLCIEGSGGKSCSGEKMLPGPSRFEILFQDGWIYVGQWDRTLLKVELDTEGIEPFSFLDLPRERRYGGDVYLEGMVEYKDGRGWKAVAAVLIPLLATATLLYAIIRKKV